MITGSAHRDTHSVLIKEANQQLIGVLYYIDGASTGLFNDMPVTAVKFSLTCFTREARLRADMWATLGYLPKVKIAEGRGKKIFKDSQHVEAEDIDVFDGEGEEIDLDGNDSDSSSEGLTEVKAQDFHFMLSVILGSFVELQDRGMMWDLKYKNQVYRGLQFVFFVNTVRCDTEEADTLCGKYQIRTGNVKHLCRQCHIPTKEADNHLANFPDKTQTQIEKLVSQGNLERLKGMSQHYLKNAWYKVRFNQANDRGIHGACPSEMLHQLQLGIFKYTRDIFFSSLGDSASVSFEVNGLARIYGKLLSHQSDRSLPDTNFAKGIKEGKLMAKNYRGVLLIMAVVLRSTGGRELLRSKRKFKHDHNMDDWLLLVELLLEWESFLCLPRMKIQHVKRLEKKHRYIMYVMKKVAKRSKGMGLNLMKFHAIVHLCEDMLVNGVPLEVDTAANESHHKPTKFAAQLTQRNESTFQKQVATRMWEFNILDLALDELLTGERISDYFDILADQMTESNPSSGSAMSTSSGGMDNKDDAITDGATLEVFEDEDGNACFQIRTRSKFREKTTIHQDLIDFLVELQQAVIKYLPGNHLPIFTRHRRFGQIFHGHPNYRGQGPWKDWAIIDWGAGHGCLPGHINCFVELEGLPTGRNRLNVDGVVLEDGFYAVVESAVIDDSPGELEKSDLMVPFLKQVEGIDENGAVTGRLYYLAATHAFVKPCALVPDIGGPANRYFMVKSRHLWHKEFIQWIERPHHEDDMVEEEED